MLFRPFAIALTLAAAGSVLGLPVKRADIPTSVHLYAQDSAGEDIAYMTEFGLAYQLFFENLVREGQPVRLPDEGTFSVRIVEGSWNADKTQVDIQIVRASDSMPLTIAEGEGGYFSLDPDASAPTTITAKQQVKSGFFSRSFWYLQKDWSLVDAHEDDIRDGYLGLATTKVDGGRSTAIYLVSA